MNGTDLVGEVFFLQDGGQTQGYRNLFGLAPISVSGNYAFGGFVNLNILHPTAGREALSRESIEHVANIVALIEAEVSNELAETDAADRNQNFSNISRLTGLIAHAASSLLNTGAAAAVSMMPGISVSTLPTCSTRSSWRCVDVRPPDFRTWSRSTVPEK